MREIKFRKWDGNEMSETFQMGSVISECISGDDIVMQYTGFKDKNGKEIYEGDICKRILDKRHRFIHDEEWFDLWFIEWLDSTCGFTTTYIEKGGKLKRNSFSQRFVEMDEVIGNIYENLELLKENL
ncbi:MAG: YopX family protein [Minisyncoccales bacterium]|jgi:uncharacterized phage protein (TIGR01671 family)